MDKAMENVEKWTHHSPMSDPAGHAAVIGDLPSDVGLLNDVIQGLLVHADWLTEYGLDESRLQASSRITLPVADRLDAILETDGRCLRTQRPPDNRGVGTCRDFALMLCAFLRSKGVPSRLRCGFAAYFGSSWEDHWVCEYWHRETQAWRLSDPQIDRMLKDRYRIAFDPANVPRQSFVTAGQAWSGCRAARFDPDRYGHGKVTGLWFVKVNVFRDHWVMNGKALSAWDGWRAASPSKRVVHDREVELLDSLAAHPEQRLIEVTPDWLL